MSYALAVSLSTAMKGFCACRIAAAWNAANTVSGPAGNCVATDMTIRSPSSHWAITLGLKDRRVNGAAADFLAIVCVRIFHRNQFVARATAADARPVFAMLPSSV